MTLPAPVRLASLLGGELRGTPAQAPLRSVAIDSRRVLPGDLFFALGGRRRDGHDFATAAEAARLDERIAQLRERTATLRKEGGNVEANARASMLARLLGGWLSVADIMLA